MERTIILIFLCIAAEWEIGKPSFIHTDKNWLEAQTHCRQYNNDPFFVSSQRDQDKLLKAAGKNSPVGWINLHRGSNNITAWVWSGGADFTYQNRADNQPDLFGGKEYNVHLMTDGKWNDNANDTASVLPWWKWSPGRRLWSLGGGFGETDWYSNTETSIEEIILYNITLQKTVKNWIQL